MEKARKVERSAIWEMVWAIVWTMAFLFSSCGGGGGNDNPPSPEPEANFDLAEVRHFEDTKYNNAKVVGCLIFDPGLGWIARVNVYNNTPLPKTSHPVFEYLRYLAKPSAEGKDWEVKNWKEFSCDNLQAQGEVVVENQNDSQKGNCDVAGMLCYSSVNNSWIRKMVYYNKTPEPTDSHEAFLYTKELSWFPTEAGSDGETLNFRQWQCNALEVETRNIEEVSKGDCLLSGMLLWDPNVQKWVARVNYYNETPLPSFDHPVYEYVRYLEVPSDPGDNWETYGYKTFACSEEELELERVTDPEKGDCDVAGMLVYRSTEENWIRRIEFYNNTSEPQEGNPVFDYIRTLPLPAKPGEDDQKIDWQDWQCNDLETTIRHREDPAKEDCLVAGMLLWNPDKKVWERRINYYNQTPVPSFDHPVYEYIKYLPVPEEPGIAWETSCWKAFPCN